LFIVSLGGGNCKSKERYYFIVCVQ